LKIFHPKLHVKNIQKINLEALKAKGITNLMIDLDETLRKRNSMDMPQSSIDWINEVKSKGFKVCITSNNPFPWRNAHVGKMLGVPVGIFAMKPFPLAFHHAMWLLKSKPQNTALIGDQLLTDILGANMLGIYSILVDPFTGAEKGVFRRIMRWLEQVIFPRVNLDL
jgi:HAD superfamily phosphatase (TIGR01668 family)